MSSTDVTLPTMTSFQSPICCPACGEVFRAGPADTVPYTLNCGHSLCLSCVDALRLLPTPSCAICHSDILDSVRNEGLEALSESLFQELFGENSCAVATVDTSPPDAPSHRDKRSKVTSDGTDDGSAYVSELEFLHRRLQQGMAQSQACFDRVTAVRQRVQAEYDTSMSTYMIEVEEMKAKLAAHVNDTLAAAKKMLHQRLKEVDTLGDEFVVNLGQLRAVSAMCERALASSLPTERSSCMERAYNSGSLVVSLLQRCDAVRLDTINAPLVHILSQLRDISGQLGTGSRVSGGVDPLHCVVTGEALKGLIPQDSGALLAKSNHLHVQLCDSRGEPVTGVTQADIAVKVSIFDKGAEKTYFPQPVNVAEVVVVQGGSGSGSVHVYFNVTEASIGCDVIVEIFAFGVSLPPVSLCVREVFTAKGIVRRIVKVPASSLNTSTGAILAVHEASKRAVVVDKTGSDLGVFKLPKFKLVRKFTAPPAPSDGGPCVIADVCFTRASDGSTVLLVDSTNKNVKEVTLSGVLVRTIDFTFSPLHWMETLASVACNGSIIAVGKAQSSPQCLDIIDFEDGTLVKSVSVDSNVSAWTGSSWTIPCVRFSQDGKRLVFCESNRKWLCWLDVERDVIHQITISAYVPRCLEVYGDEYYVLVGHQHPHLSFQRYRKPHNHDEGDTTFPVMGDIVMSHLDTSQFDSMHSMAVQGKYLYVLDNLSSQVVMIE